MDTNIGKVSLDNQIGPNYFESTLNFFLIFVQRNLNLSNKDTTKSVAPFLLIPPQIFTEAL